MKSVPLVFVVLTCLTAPAFGEAYQSEKGKYEVTFPENRVKVTNQKLTVDGKEVAFESASVNPGRGSTAYSVSYYDLESSVDVNTILKRAKEGSIKQTRGELVSETEIAADGNPGLQFTVKGSVTGKPVVYQSQCFVAGKRFYQLQIISLGGDSVSLVDAAKFFGSFKLKE